VEEVTLTQGQIPEHDHDLSTDGAHTHTGNTSFLVAGTTYNIAGNSNIRADDLGATDEAGAHNHGGKTGVKGGGNAHTNMQPTLVVNYIIKT
jgi:microcystin-dependent protein